MEVAQVVPDFADAFPFDEFNRMQREAVPALLESDVNVVASAPTASGKTALAELAICRTLRAGGTALFIAPLRALTNEKEREWARFEELGYSVYVVTGERDLNPRRAARADVLVMTPEKADSATRKHDSRRYGFVTDVDLVIIDEVHLLDSESRGSVLEVTVARFRRLCQPRIVALSATMPNVEDVAAWLDAPPEATFQFGDEYRPVPLHADVKTYSRGENAFADKYRRLYRALDLAEPHLREDGQALVFVASRQDTVQAAKKARDVLAERDVPIGARGDYDLHNAASQLSNDTLRQSVIDGVAFHHAGLSAADKNRVESWFREGTVDLLFSTSTLAWGVNLPARCVVIRDTKLHDPLEGEVDMSPIDVLQMLGRAGRPGFDDVGYGWVVASPGEADRYRSLLREGTPVESRLADDLDAHLVAEVALGTVGDLADAVEWLETTFYAVRSATAPDRYDADGLRDRTRETIADLVDRGFIGREDGGGLTPTSLGRLASSYYLRLRTAERFRDLADRTVLDSAAVLVAVAGAAEFDSVSARRDEREAIDRALSGLSTGTDLADGGRKVLAILHGSMRDRVPSPLASDAWIIRQNALRLLSALRTVLARFGDPRQAALVKRTAARVEHGVSADAVGLTAIDGVGAGRASTIYEAGFESPAAVAAADPTELSAAGLAPGVAERIREQAEELPEVDIDWGDFPDRISRGQNDLREVTVVNRGGGVRAALRVTVNDVEMTSTDLFLDEQATVPVGVFGGDAETMCYAVEVTFPDLPLRPTVAERTVVVGDD